MKPEELDRLYKHKFDQYQGEVPDELWENIAEEIGPKRDRRGFIWFLAGCIGLGITLTAAQILFSFYQEKVPIPSAGKTSTVYSQLDTLPFFPPALSSTPAPYTASSSSDYLQAPIKYSYSTTNTNLKSIAPPVSAAENLIPDVSLTAIFPEALSLQPVISHVPVPTLPGWSYSPRPLSPQSDWKFYTGLSPFLAYHHIHPKLNDEVFIAFPELTPELSSERLGISVEFGVMKALSPHIYWKAGMTGMYYRQSFILEQTTFSGYEVVSGSDLKSGIQLQPTFNQPEVVSAQLEVLDLGLHTGLGIRLGSNPTSAVIESGLTAYLPLAARRLSVGDPGQFSENRLSWALSASGKLPILLSPSSHLLIGPSITYGLTDWDFQQNPFSVSPYQIGIGCTYIFP